MFLVPSILLKLLWVCLKIRVLTEKEYDIGVGVQLLIPYFIQSPTPTAYSLVYNVHNIRNPPPPIDERSHILNYLTVGGFPIEIEAEISKLITYSLTIFIS